MELKNAVVVQAAGTALCAVLSFALLMLLGRVLGSDGFGLYVWLLGLATLALIVVEGGWPTLLYRDTARPDATPARTEALAAHALGWILVSAMALGVAGAGLAWIGWPAHAGFAPADLAAAMLCMGCVATMNLVSGRLRGAGRFAREAMWQVAGRVLSAGCIVLAVVYAAPSFAGIFAAWAAGLAIVLVLYGRRWLAAPRWRGWHGASRLAVPFVMFEGLLALLLRSDVAVLGALGVPRASLSHYAACTRWTEAALLVFAPAANVILRGVLHARDEAAGRRLAMRFTWFAFACGCGCAALGAAFGDRLMPAVFGPEFAPAGALLPWVAAMLPFALANLVRFQWALAAGRERGLVARLALGVALLLVALCAGNAVDGIRGAAVGVMLAQAALLASSLAAARVCVPRRMA